MGTITLDPDAGTATIEDVPGKLTTDQLRSILQKYVFRQTEIYEDAESQVVAEQLDVGCWIVAYGWKYEICEISAKTFQITIDAGSNGTVTTEPADEVVYGGSVVITLQPEADCMLRSAEVNGKSILDLIEDNQYTVSNVREDLEIQAEFSAPAVLQAQWDFEEEHGFRYRGCRPKWPRRHHDGHHVHQRQEQRKCRLV